MELFEHWRNEITRLETVGLENLPVESKENHEFMKLLEISMGKILDTIADMNQPETREELFNYVFHK